MELLYHFGYALDYIHLLLDQHIHFTLEITRIYRDYFGDTSILHSYCFEATSFTLSFQVGPFDSTWSVRSILYILFYGERHTYFTSTTTPSTRADTTTHTILYIQLSNQTPCTSRISSVPLVPQPPSRKPIP